MAGKRWTEEEMEILRVSIADGKKCADVAMLLGRTVSAVRKKFNDIGLKKPQLKVGDKVNRLTVLSLYNKLNNGQNHTYAKCECECGKITHPKLSSVKNGMTKSCGCIRNTPERHYTHGFGDLKNRLYRSWCSIRCICNNPNMDRYKYFGGRGIKLCKEWSNNFLTFRIWSLDNGYTDDLSLDLIDHNCDYGPTNCQWVLRKDLTPKKADSIRINAVMITAFEETKSITRWLRDERCMVKSVATIAYRIGIGWPTENAISKPSERATKKKKKKNSRGPNKTPKPLNEVTIKDIRRRLYAIWYAIKDRCTNIEHGSYYRYGGRGISICQEWYNIDTFHNWAIHNGYMQNLSLDRINNDGNYEPSNCQWVDMKTQANNRWNNRLDTVTITAFNETKSLRNWMDDDRCKVKASSTVGYRIGSGWTSEDALSKPDIIRNKGLT